MQEQWIEEVLFRGRPPSGPDSEKSPLFHVVFGVQTDDPLNEGQKLRKLVGPVGSAKAREMGYTPAMIVADINQAAFEENEKLQARIAELEGSVSELVGQKVALLGQVEEFERRLAQSDEAQ